MLKPDKVTAKFMQYYKEKLNNKTLNVFNELKLPGLNEFCRNNNER